MTTHEPHNSLPFEPHDAARSDARAVRTAGVGSAGRHLPFLALGIAVPVLALLMDVTGEGRRICFRLLPQVALPEVCLTRRTVGIDCPGCGLTRSVIHLVHGRFAASLTTHRLGGLVFSLIVLQVPYRLCRLAGYGRSVTPRPRLVPVFWCGLAVLLVLNRAWDWLALL